LSIYESEWYKEQVRKAVEELDKQTIKRMYELEEKLNKEKEGEKMIEKDVYQFKTHIKVGIMYSIYTHLGLINDVDFSLLNDNTLDAYLEGALRSTTNSLRKSEWEEWNVGLMYENKCFMGYVINKDKERLKEQLVNAMIDFRNPKYSIVEV